MTELAKLRSALLDAVKKASQNKEVEVRVKFDDMDDALIGMEVLIVSVSTLGLYDHNKTMAATAITGDDLVIELKNGSCLNIQLADKMWAQDHWIRLCDDVPGTNTGS